MLVGPKSCHYVRVGNPPKVAASAWRHIVGKAWLWPVYSRCQGKPGKSSDNRGRASLLARAVADSWISVATGDHICVQRCQWSAARTLATVDSGVRNMRLHASGAKIKNNHLWQIGSDGYEILAEKWFNYVFWGSIRKLSVPKWVWARVERYMLANRYLSTRVVSSLGSFWASECCFWTLIGNVSNFAPPFVPCHRSPSTAAPNRPELISHWPSRPAVDPWVHAMWRQTEHVS